MESNTTKNSTAIAIVGIVILAAIIVFAFPMIKNHQTFSQRFASLFGQTQPTQNELPPFVMEPVPVVPAAPIIPSLPQTGNGPTAEGSAATSL